MHALEAHPREIHRDLRAAHSMMAYDDGLAIWIEFGEPRRDVAHRDMRRAGKGSDRDFGGFTNVEDEHPLAAIDARLERDGFYISDLGQSRIKMLTRARVALRIDFVGKQFDFREHR